MIGRKCKPTRRPPRPHPLLHEIGIENDKRQYRDRRHDGDVGPELDDVETARRTEQRRSRRIMNTSDWTEACSLIVIG